MSAWADGLLRTSVQGALAILIVVALLRAFPRIPGHVQVWMWRGIALKFLLGMVMPITIWTSTWNAGGYVVGDPLPEIIFAASAAGLILALVAIARDLWAVRKLKRSGVPASLPILGGLCKRIGLKKTPAILLRTDLDGPLLSGAARPTIHLPADLSEEAQRMVISHELAHIKRRDLAWEWLFVALEGIFFFHPLVWLMRREHRMAQEIACDEIALRAAQTSLGQYGRMLLDLTVASKRKELALTANMARTYAALRTRIVRLHQGSRIGVTSTLVLATATLALIPTWRTEFRVEGPAARVGSRTAVTPATNFGAAAISGPSRTLKEGRQ